MTKRRRGRPANPAAKRRQTTRAGQGRTETAITEDALRRRAAAAGVGVGDARDARCGTALGRLLLRGSITEAQWEAGEAFGRLYRLYARLAECPAATPRAVPLPYRTDTDPEPLTGIAALVAEMERDEADEDRWPRVRDTYRWLTRLLLRAGVQTYSLVYGVCVEDDVPVSFLDRTEQLAALRAGLSIIAAERGIRDVAAEAA